MDVIKTATAVADKFGPGLNGFRSESPGLPATQLSPEWADSVQMELVYAITSQGLVLDGLVFNQLQQAIDKWSFAGSPSIQNGQALVLQSGAMLLASSGATVEIQSGGGLVLKNGSTFAIESSVTLIAANNTWTWGSTNSNNWTINGNVTLGTNNASLVELVGDVNIGFDASSAGAISGNYTLFGSISGASSTVVSVGSVGQTVGRWVDSLTLLPSVAGYKRWNGTFWSFKDQNNVVRTFEESVRGYDAQAQTVTPLAATTATCTRKIKHNEPAWIEFGARCSVDAANAVIFYRLEVTGPLGTVTLINTDIGSGPVANVGNALADGLYWTPTDSWPAETLAQNYTFLLSIGVDGGGANIVTSDRVRIKACSALEV